MSEKKGKENGQQVHPTNVENETNERGNWSNKWEFFLSCLGYAVGLGNVWRFPYLCYKNGGGAFLIPYVIMLAFCGLPLFFLELSLGQYCGIGPNIVFKQLSPIFRGVGFAMLMVSFLVVLYYNMIIAWTLFYTFASFTKQLPWEFCGNSWNSIACYNPDQNEKCQKQNLTYWNNTCYDPIAYCNNIPNLQGLNMTHCLNTTNNSYITLYGATKHISPSEEYYLTYVLNISDKIENFGNIRWQLALCLLLAWLIVGVCLIKGVKSSGKVVYFTALFPYVVLVILLIRGALLPGASDGVYFYIVPKWEKLKEAQVWIDAATQIFYSLGPGFGGLLTLASYNQFKNNCYRDAIVISICNCGTSVFAGFVIFSILGFMAYTLKLPVDKVVQSGQGLAFIAYPEVVTKLPISPLWSFLFFFMLITLGLDSQFTMCETLITALHDEWKSLQQKKFLVVIATCLICFLFGLPLCAEGGVYLFTLLDWYSAGWSLLIISLVECLSISWHYGIKRYSKNIKEMIGHEPNLYWKICWCGLSPLIMLGLLIFNWVTYTPATYGNYKLPRWANGLGWAIACSSVILIPIFAVYEISKAIIKKQPLKYLIKPTSEWGPQKSSESKVIQLAQVMPPNYQSNYQETYDNPTFQYMTNM